MERTTQRAGPVSGSHVATDGAVDGRGDAGRRPGCPTEPARPGQDAQSVLACLQLGKRIHDSTYLHRSAVELLPDLLREMVRQAAAHGRVAEDAFHVVKFSLRERRLSLLAYPGFFTEAFPVLAASWVVDLSSGRSAYREYAEADNPPVLHRKEEMLAPDHPAYSELAALTAAAEEAGLFDDPGSIGTKLQWEETLRAHAVGVDGLRLVPLEAGTIGESGETSVSRHRTAMARRGFSSPIQLLARHGYLDGKWSVFDYGCGRGDDVYLLRQRDLAACGWDPYFAPDEPLQDADIVNLGFVLNVIEKSEERRQALASAFRLARKLLVVAVLVGGRTAFERCRLFQDGVLTAHGTFQKYFTQEELRQYLEQNLGREPIAVGPGIFFVFRQDEDEQQFLAERQHLRNRQLDAGWRGAVPLRLPTAARPRRQRAATPAKASGRWLAAQYNEILDALWERALMLGRMPFEDEFDRAGEILAVGRFSSAFRHLLAAKGSEAYEAAQRERRDDLLVYQALNLFERRRSIRALPVSVQRDVKVLFGSHSTVLEEATRHLFSIAKPDVILEACRAAQTAGVGFLDGEHALFLHASLVPRLPVVLRVFIGCAARLFGDLEAADVVKLHVQSGKVSLHYYDDFDGKPIPRLVGRVKINLRRQIVDVFDHAEQPPQPLYLKSRYLGRDHPRYDEQIAFDAAIQELAAFEFSGFGPELAAFDAELKARKLAIRGHRLVQLKKPGDGAAAAARARKRRPTK